MTGDEARTRLRATLDAGGLVIGAGAGTGLSAKCAEAGGADRAVATAVRAASKSPDLIITISLH